MSQMKQASINTPSPGRPVAEGPYRSCDCRDRWVLQCLRVWAWAWVGRAWWGGNAVSSRLAQSRWGCEMVLKCVQLLAGKERQQGRRQARGNGDDSCCFALPSCRVGSGRVPKPAAANLPSRSRARKRPETSCREFAPARLHWPHLRRLAAPCRQSWLPSRGRFDVPGLQQALARTWGSLLTIQVELEST